MNAQDDRYCVKIKPRSAVRLCNCVHCGREVLGLADREQAHPLGLPVVVYVLEKPYCPACARPEGAKQATCCHCGERPFLRDMRPEVKIVGDFPDQVERVKLYCLWCSSASLSVPRPLPIGCRDDVRHTPPPGCHNLFDQNREEIHEAA